MLRPRRNINRRMKMDQITRAGKEKTDGAKVASRGELLATHHMPESLAAEAAVLGSMIIDPECISEVLENLNTAAVFYRIEHQMIFDALISLYEKSRSENVAIDAVLLRDELEKRKQIEDVGGVEYLRRVMDSVPSSDNVMYYADIVKGKQLLRELIVTVDEILNDAYDEGGEPSEKLDRAEQKIFEVAAERIRGLAVPVKNLVAQAFELIEKRNINIVTGLATGYRELDNYMCGLQNGEMIIIAGRPSIGKTSLALNIAEHLGLVEKVPVGIFSLEMASQQLAERFLCSRSQIDAQRVRKGILGDEDYEAIRDACGELSEAPIYIDDTSLLTPLELRAKSRRLKRLYDIRCIIVDYMQLMSGGTGRFESRQQEISVISRYLKALASELKIPVVVLSQLNRAPEGREDHRPRMSDLRESGSIEQDADVVLLLHREDYYRRSERLEISDKVDSTMRSNEDSQNIEGAAELIIAKQRNGPTGTVKLLFRKQIMRFENASVAAEPGVGAPPYRIVSTGDYKEEPPF
jgi:replicative DNA helicase